MPELPLVGDEFAGHRLRAVIALKVLVPGLVTDGAFRAGSPDR